MSRHVDPTLDDPVVASLSEVVGGPMGTRAGPARWWTPLRVILLLTAVCFALGLTTKATCAAGDFDAGRAGDARLCTSDVAAAYVPTGLVELAWPWSDDEQVRARYAVTERPPLEALWAWTAARATHVLTGSDDLGPIYRSPVDRLESGQGEVSDRVAHERLVFTAVNVAGLALLALLAVAALAAVHRRRPWDAAAFGLAPVLLLAGPDAWDLVAVAAVAGALWSWSRGRPVRAGVFVGVGVAAGVWVVLLLVAAGLVAARRRRLVDVLPTTVTAVAVWAVLNAPAFLTGRRQWERSWDALVSGVPDRGSIWLVLDATAGVPDRAVLTASLILLGAWIGAVLLLTRTARVTPRLSQVAFLLVAGVTLVGVTYRPEQALWLLPLAALARPRWRDLLVWQAGEVFFFAMDWWWRGGYLEPGGGGQAGFYWIAIGVRMACTLWLVAAVVRDVWWAQADPVREERELLDLEQESDRPARAAVPV